jgi:hypothetical protein
MEGNLYVTQHGRDQLHTNWPEIIKDPTQEATLPAEELMLLKNGELRLASATTIRLCRS